MYTNQQLCDAFDAGNRVGFRARSWKCGEYGSAQGARDALTLAWIRGFRMGWIASVRSFPSY